MRRISEALHRGGSIPPSSTEVPPRLWNPSFFSPLGEIQTQSVFYWEKGGPPDGCTPFLPNEIPPNKVKNPLSTTFFSIKKKNKTTIK